MKSGTIWKISVSLFIFSSALIFAGCSHLPKSTPIKTEEGVASFYGEEFHGKYTSSGEIYNMYGLSAAHKTLPLGTKVRVINLDNGNMVTCKINDRGPFVGGRIIDMSYGAARVLAMCDSGLVNVRIEVLEYPGYELAGYSIQFGAYREKANAENMASKLKAMKYDPIIETVKSNGQDLFRVRMGLYNSADKAKETAGGLKAAGIPCMVIPL